MSIVNNIDQLITLQENNISTRSQHMGINPQNFDLDNIFKNPSLNGTNRELLTALENLVNKNQLATKCDIPNSPYPGGSNVPRCIPQKQCMEQPVSLISGGNPGSVYNYSGVGSLLPKFAYTELYDPSYYS
tara:strand:- start:209 stop:601 length:393 start_codon:yes stop_codon:yes gene_type:complete